MSTASGLRLAAAGAALVLAVTSRGDAFALAVALGLAAWRPVAAVAVAAALGATAWRWGSSSLEAIAGAQAVLGPAGWVGPGPAAAGSWLAALAIAVACPSFQARGPRLVAALASGTAAAVVVAGPASGGDVWARVLAAAVGTGLAFGASVQRRARPRMRLGVDVAAVLSAAAALACVAQDAGGWAGVLDTDAVGDGLAVGLATGCIVLVAQRGRAAMEQPRR